MWRLYVLAFSLCMHNCSSGGLLAQTRKVEAAAGSARRVWSLEKAPVDKRVKRRILALLKGNGAFDDQIDLSQAATSLARLNSAGRTGIRVIGPRETCGATGNCPVWIFDGRTGSELVSDDGWDYGFRKTVHHGLYDFYIRANMSAGSGTRHEYRFDGRVYKLTVSVDETYDQ